MPKQAPTIPLAWPLSLLLMAHNGGEHLANPEFGRSKQAQVQRPTLQAIGGCHQHSRITLHAEHPSIKNYGCLLLGIGIRRPIGITTRHDIWGAIFCWNFSQPAWRALIARVGWLHHGPIPLILRGTNQTLTSTFSCRTRCQHLG